MQHAVDACHALPIRLFSAQVSMCVSTNALNIDSAGDIRKEMGSRWQSRPIWTVSCAPEGMEVALKMARHLGAVFQELSAQHTDTCCCLLGDVSDCAFPSRGDTLPYSMKKLFQKYLLDFDQVRHSASCMAFAVLACRGSLS